MSTPWTFAALFLLFIAAFAGNCQPQPITSVNVHDNTGPVTVDATGGSASPASSAPCGALGAPQKGNGLAAPSCDNSTTTNTSPADLPPGTTITRSLPPETPQ